MTNSSTGPKVNNWAAIIEAVRTPLGFYSLSVLAAEAILGTTAGFANGLDRTILVYGMLGSLVSLIFLVAGISIWRPDALYGKPPTVLNIEVNKPELEKSVSEEIGARELVGDPRILVADALPGVQLRDAAVVRSAWPAANVSELQQVTPERLASVLLKEDISILQLSANVTANGDVQLHDGIMTAKGLAELARQQDVRLIVLASCNSATMAAEVAPHVNMIAATQNLGVRDWEQWSAIFYTLLGNGVPLSQAYSVAQSVVNAPIVMITRKDIAFRSS